jgi:catechol 2,3-dioxygenase-like lactoylglutathione lyase family enzyme
MKKRTGDPWMSGAEYGRSLVALTVNLLVKDVAATLAFQREVLGASVVYADADFAVVAGHGAQWMFHADHTYDRHPLHAVVAGVARRGAGVELRLHGCDPDRAEAAARRLGFEVVAGAANKPHGVREAFLADADGYVWVPDVPIPDPGDRSA